MNTDSKKDLAHIIDWNMEHNRPIVDGKFTHPMTGEVVQHPSGENRTDGPPGVSLELFNLNPDVKMRSIHGTSYIPLELITCAVARQLDMGTYKLVSLHVSKYSFVIMCEIQVSKEEFDVAWRNMFALKKDWLWTDEEADEAFLKLRPDLRWMKEGEKKSEAG